MRVPALKLLQKLRSDPKLSKILPRTEGKYLSQRVNGVGSFVPSICRVTLSYNTPRMGAGGDSQQLVTFLSRRLPSIAKERPYIDFTVVHRNGPPTVEATYSNGFVKTVNLRRMDQRGISRTLNELCDSSAADCEKPRLYPVPVEKGVGSCRDSVVASWTPFDQQTFQP